MDLRTDGGGAPPQRGTRSALWVVIAVILIAGIVLALMYGPRLTPVLDTIH